MLTLCFTDFQDKLSPVGSNMASSPPSVLREYCPLYYLLSAIPAKVLNPCRPEGWAVI